MLQYIKGLGFLVVCVAVVVGLVVAAWWLSSAFPSPNANAWQAVFLTNDQVYFGKLQSKTSDYAVLSQVFYLRVSDQLQQGGTTGPALNLVKLGGELHGPDDIMYLPKDKIMFWENLKADSQVVVAIDNFYKAQ